jgi:hypothetical protein
MTPTSLPEIVAEGTEEENIREYPIDYFASKNGSLMFSYSNHVTPFDFDEAGGPFAAKKADRHVTPFDMNDDGE